MIAWVVTGLVLGALIAAAIGYAMAQGARRRRSTEALTLAQGAVPEELEITGSLVVQHRDATPDTGRGAIKLAARGLMWQIPGGLHAGGGSAPWRHVESVARRDISVRIVWGASDGRTTLQYRGQGAARIEGLARRHLTVPPWRFDVDAGGQRWDSQWSRRDEGAAGLFGGSP